MERSEREVRMEMFNAFKETFASAPIRLMSRTVSAMRARGYDDLASAIGDLDWRTVPADDPEDPSLRHDWPRAGATEQSSSAAPAHRASAPRREGVKTAVTAKLHPVEGDGQAAR